MTSTEQRTAPVLPTPRSGTADDRSDTAGSVVRRRPRHHYWDVTTARWRTRDGDAVDRW